MIGSSPISPSCPECGDPDTEQTPLGLWCVSCGDYASNYMEEPKMPEPMTDPAPGSNEEYYQRCSRADWTFDYSDDGAVWRAGRDAMTKLKRDANTPTKQAIFDAFDAWSHPGLNSCWTTRPTLQQILATVPVSP